MWILTRRGEAIAAAEMWETQSSLMHILLPSHSQNRALIYNSTRTEFILLWVDDQGENRMERGGRAFQPYFWNGAWFCCSLWSLSLLFFFFSCFSYFFSIFLHTEITEPFIPVQFDILYYRCTLIKAAEHVWWNTLKRCA